MIINVSPALIAEAVPGTLECPIFRALAAAGLNIHMVGCGMVFDVDAKAEVLTANAYLTVGEDALIQRLPSAVADAIKAFDKTGKMEPMEFEIPNVS